MDGTTIKYKRMEENISSMYNISNEIEGILEEIKTIFNRTVDNNSWNSIASTKVLEQFYEFTKSFNSLEESIARSVIYLSNTLDNYYETDKSLKQEIAEKFYFNGETE